MQETFWSYANPFLVYSLFWKKKKKTLSTMKVTSVTLTGLKFVFLKKKLAQPIKLSLLIIYNIMRPL